MKKNRIVFSTLILTGILICGLKIDKAQAVAHSAPHVSHAVTPHTSPHVSHTPPKINTPHVSPRIKTATPSVKNNQAKNITKPKGAPTRITNSIKQTSEYKAINKSRRSDFLSYRSHYQSLYPNKDYNFYHNNLYYWIPLWYADQHKKDYQDQVLKKDKNAKFYWVKVGDKVVEVPKKIYDKIKVGDHLELASDTKLKINGKIYER